MGSPRYVHFDTHVRTSNGMALDDVDNISCYLFNPHAYNAEKKILSKLVARIINVH